MSTSMPMRTVEQTTPYKTDEYRFQSHRVASVGIRVI